MPGLTIRFNPWWGCIRVSPGCESCYAEKFAARYGHDVWGPAKTTTRRTFGDRHWAEPFAWHKAASAEGVRRRVFCASMADVFEDHPVLHPERLQLWSLIRATPNLDWLLLTKRPENILGMIPSDFREQAPANVWYGTSVENPDYLSRIDILRQVPAVVRFISYEPALAWVDWSHHLEGIHWLIAGGESGGGARPFNINWARKARIDSSFAGTAFFMKQIGSKAYNSAGHRLKTKAYKGDDPEEWPEDLRVRQFPVGAKELVAL